MRNLILTILALTGLAAVYLAATAKPPAPAPDFIFMNGTEPETVDPHKATGVPEWHIMIGLFQGLTAHDTRTLQVIPGMAKSWEISPDGMTYTFHLRDAKWSDGKEFTSEDVLYSIERVLRPETASEYSYMVWELPNAEAYTSGNLKWLEEKTATFDEPLVDGSRSESGTTINANGSENAQPVLIIDSKPHLSDEDIKTGKKVEWVKIARIKGAVPIGWVKPEKLKGPEDGREIIDKLRPLFGVSAPDAKTVVFKLEHPVPYLLDVMTHHSWWPVPRQAIEKWGDDKWILPGHIVVDGPYTIERWELSDMVQLKKNPLYYDAANVALERVAYLPTDNRNTAFNIYATGKGNIWSEWFPGPIVDQVKKQPFFHRSPKLGNYDYRLNTTKAPFNNVLVRRALAFAIDRQYLTEFVTKGGEIPATSYVPPGLPGYEAPNMLRYDPDEARKLLAQAGYPGGKGFPTFEILFNRDDTHTKIAESIQNMWKKTLGVTVNLHPQEWKTYLGDRRVLNFDVARAAWIGDYVDPNTFLSNFFSNSGNNQTGWKNPKYDALLKEANMMMDVPARMKKLKEAETLLLTDMPMIPIYYYVNYDLYEDQRWIGIHANLIGEYKPQEVRERRPGEPADPYMITTPAPSPAPTPSPLPE
jgi:oligopeptide transport system substrate-binding protein